eukprot:TRINITY_DN9717_c0_g1_i1.p1 TRINITY_DN9717_c0_g1~~TRINITY_DN9717_c0_g1_i1.p1  ORF type:complete len:85 (+),score=16.26 TRINITY_DN9717_c0_g1_i1:381-635(+)
MQEWLQHLRKAIACNDIVLRQSNEFRKNHTSPQLSPCNRSSFDYDSSGDVDDEAKESSREKRIVKNAPRRKQIFAVQQERPSKI